MSNTKEQYTTEELKNEFEIIGFSRALIAVKRKSNGEKGSFDFGGRPRLYFDYIVD